MILPALPSALFLPALFFHLFFWTEILRCTYSRATVDENPYEKAQHTYKLLQCVDEELDIT